MFTRVLECKNVVVDEREPENADVNIILWTGRCLKRTKLSLNRSCVGIRNGNSTSRDRYLSVII